MSVAAIHAWRRGVPVVKSDPSRLLKMRGVRAKRRAGERVSGAHVAAAEIIMRRAHAVCADCGAPRASEHRCGADPRRHVATPTCMSVRIRTRL